MLGESVAANALREMRAVAYYSRGQIEGHSGGVPLGANDPKYAWYKSRAPAEAGAP